MSSEGMKVKMDSLESLLDGGITMGLPPGWTPGEPVKQMDSFTLFQDEASVLAGSLDQFIDYVFLCEDSVGGLHPGAAVEYRGSRVGTGLDLGGNQVGDDLAIGLALEHPAPGGEFGAQFLEVLDDAIVDNRHLAGRVGVSVGGRRRAMRGPAGVRDADIAGRRIAREHAHQIGKPPFGPPPHQHAIVQCADPGAVIAAIFHALQPVDQPVSDAGTSYDPDNAAHCLAVPSLSFPPL